VFEQLNLFESHPNLAPEVPQEATPFEIAISDGRLELYSHIFNQAQAFTYYQRLAAEVNWRQDHITLFGQSQPLPRLTAWYGDSVRSTNPPLPLVSSSASRFCQLNQPPPFASSLVRVWAYA
jgi:hypothetical protein